MPDKTTNVVPFRPGEHPNFADVIIKAEDVTVTRSGRNLLNGLSFSIEQTGVTTLLGPNGAGKSLILRLISGLMLADSGTLSIVPSIAANLSLVFQSPVVLRRSVKANLDHALKIYGVPKSQRTGRIAELLVMADLTNLTEAPAKTRGAAAQGTKIILVTHDWAQAQRLADDILFLHRGSATEHSPATQFFEAPTSEEGRSYLKGQILL